MSCTSLTKAEKPVWAKQMARLLTLVVYSKSQSFNAFQKLLIFSWGGCDEELMYSCCNYTLSTIITTALVNAKTSDLNGVPTNTESHTYRLKVLLLVEYRKHDISIMSSYQYKSPGMRRRRGEVLLNHIKGQVAVSLSNCHFNPVTGPRNLR